MSFPLSKIKDHYQHNYLNTQYVHTIIYDHSSRLDFEYSIKLTPPDLLCTFVILCAYINLLHFMYMLRYKSLSICTLVNYIKQ